MDKTELEALIQSVLALNEADYTTTSWSNLQTELTAAQAVNDDTEATQQEIDDAVTALQAANDALVAAADKTALQSAITTAETLVETDYTPTTWGPFELALTDANAVNGNGDATQQSVDDATTALTTAQSNLVERADKTALQSKLAEANALVETDYTPNSWTGFPQAISDAQTVYDNANASQAVVDTAVTDLDTAINALVARADFSVLNQTIAAAQALEETDYTPNSWTVLQQSLTDAQTVAADLNATQTQVNQSNTALNNAMSSLVERANKTALQATISEAETKIEADYTPASWSSFSSALSQANAVNGNLNATQAETDTANSDLSTAMAGLVESADKVALQTAIDGAESRNEADYVSSTWPAFVSALADANTVNDDANATQSAVDNALQTLIDAEAALIERGDKTALNTAITNAESLLEDDYTLDSWNAMQVALAAAIVVRDDIDAVQADVDSAETTLSDAVTALVEFVPADKAALESKIAEAQAIEQGNYTQSTWMALQSAINDAIAVNDDYRASQASVDDAVQAVQAAIDGLIESNDELNEDDLMGIQLCLDQYSTVMAKRHVVSRREIVRQHLCLLLAFRLALSYDDRNQVTQAMDQIYGYFSDNATGAFGEAHTKRESAFFHKYFPVEATMFDALLETTYQTVNASPEEIAMFMDNQDFGAFSAAVGEQMADNHNYYINTLA